MVNMNYQSELTGIVLSATPVGDYDKRMVILTKEKGKITAFAKGARKPTSQYLACSQPFVYGKFNLYQGREAYSLNGANISNFFSELRMDLDMVSLGMYFCELAAYYTVENQPEPKIVEFLYETLKAIMEKKLDYKLIRSIFELKLAALNGEAPIPYECVNCHTNDLQELAGISLSIGAAVCKKHENDYVDLIHMDAASIYAAHYVATKPIDKMYSFNLTSPSKEDFIFYVNRYMRQNVKRQFKSLELLEAFANFNKDKGAL